MKILYGKVLYGKSRQKALLCKRHNTPFVSIVKTFHDRLFVKFEVEESLGGQNLL